MEVGHGFHETTLKAEEFGISTRAMVGMTVLATNRAEEWEVGLQRLQKNIGEAAGGSKEAQAKFEALGLSWKTLEALPLDQAAGKVNDAINAGATNASKASAAFEIYGRKGQDLLRIIEQGSKGINEAQDKATAKGLVPDKKFTEDYKEYLAAKKDLEQTWQGITNKFTILMGHPLVKLATGTLKAVSTMLEGYDYGDPGGLKNGSSGGCAFCS